MNTPVPTSLAAGRTNKEGAAAFGRRPPLYVPIFLGLLLGLVFLGAVVLIDVFTDVFTGVFTDVFTDVFADVVAGASTGAFTDVFTGVFIDVFTGVFTDAFTDVVTYVFNYFINFLCKVLITRRSWHLRSSYFACNEIHTRAINLHHQNDPKCSKITYFCSFSPCVRLLPLSPHPLQIRNSILFFFFIAF